MACTLRSTLLATAALVAGVSCRMDNPEFQKETDGGSGGNTVGSSTTTAGNGPSTMGSTGATSSSATSASTTDPLTTGAVDTTATAGMTGAVDTTATTGGLGTVGTTGGPPEFCPTFEESPLTLDMTHKDVLQLVCGTTFPFSGKVTSSIDSKWNLDVCPTQDVPCGVGCNQSPVNVTLTFDTIVSEAQPVPISPGECVQVVVDTASDCTVNGIVLHVSKFPPFMPSEDPWYIGQADAPSGGTPYVTSKGWEPTPQIGVACACKDPNNNGCCDPDPGAGQYELEFSAFAGVGQIPPLQTMDGQLDNQGPSYEVTNLASHLEPICPAGMTVRWAARHVP